jgi:hypothetical protein
VAKPARQRVRTRRDHENVISEMEIPLAREPATSDISTGAEASPLATTQAKGNPMADTGNLGEKRERRQNLTYTYRDKDGQEVEKFTDDSRSVIYMIDASGKKVELALAEIIKDQSVIDWLAEHAPIAIRAALFGLKTTVGNAVTSVKNGSPDEMLQAIENRKETLIEGEWREGGERGPSPKLVLEAMLNWYAGKTGKQANETKVRAFKDIIRQRGTKQVLTDSDILAEFEAVKLREQQKKVDEAKLQAAAGKPAPTELDALLSD